MQEVKRASMTSTLSLGTVEAEVKLFKTMGKGEGGTSFVTAGPNGHALRAEKRAVEADVDAVEEGNPFGVGEEEAEAEDATVVPAAAPVDDSEIPAVPAAGVAPAGATSAPGEFKTVMVEEETGVEVEPEDVRKGVRLPSGEFVDLTDRLEAIDEQTKLDRIQVLDFIRRERVPRERVVGSYYLAAGDKGMPPRILRLLYEAMKRSQRVAVVRWTKVKGQSLGLLVPHSSGALVVLEVSFGDEARKPNAVCLAHMKAAVKESHVESAVELVASMSGPPSVIDAYVDRRDQLQRELAETALDQGDLSAFEAVEKPADEVAQLDEILKAATG